MGDPAASKPILEDPARPFRAEIPPYVRIVRITPELELAAAARLVTEAPGPRAQAARRMLAAAAMHGIDLSLMWGSIEQGDRPTRVRQVCLTIPGSGRTAMLMLSGPGGGGGADIENAERVACVAQSLIHLRTRSEPDIRLAQALPDPKEAWAVRAFADAGFINVGDLAYMRRPRSAHPVSHAPPVWPESVTVRQVRSLAKGDPDRAALQEALERSYESTLDCPELCGLRDTADVLESHMMTGVLDPRLWWLVFDHDRPSGCMLLSRCPEQDTVELVYLGLAPRLRGMRMGARLLELGLAQIEAMGATSVTCAVDLRNEPALRLYGRFGFREFARRVALVCPTR